MSQQTVILFPWLVSALFYPTTLSTVRHSQGYQTVCVDIEVSHLPSTRRTLLNKYPHSTQCAQLLMSLFSPKLFSITCKAKYLKGKKKAGEACQLLG